MDGNGGGCSDVFDSGIDTLSYLSKDAYTVGFYVLGAFVAVFAVEAILRHMTGRVVAKQNKHSLFSIVEDKITRQRRCVMRQYVMILLATTLWVWSMSADVAAQKTGAYRDYKEAIEAARQKGALLIAVIVKEHCGWCEKLILRTLSDTQVAKRLRESYVLYIAEKDENYPVMLNEEFFPSTFFIDPQSGQSIYENIGYVNKQDFLKDIQSAEEIRRSLYEDQSEAKGR